MQTSETDKIRLLIVDDSVIVRGIWAHFIEKEPDMRVIDRAGNGADGITALRKNRVDVILLDLEMPVMDGLTAIPLLLKEVPGVKIIIASTLTSHGSQAALKAISLGASDFVTKPSTMAGAKGFDEMAVELLRKIRALGAKKSDRAGPLRSATVAALRPLAPTLRPRVIAIGTSTGGPAALQVVFGALSKDVNLPILLVQHMPPYFTTTLADSLTKSCGRPCKEAIHGEPLVPGRVYVAPGDFHMTVTQKLSGPCLEIDQSPAQNFCRPSVDPTFRSASEVYGSGLLAVVLTGLGDDGRAGSEAVVKNGGSVIVQDEATSVIWGMPGAVAKAGLASAVLPLGQVASEIEKICGIPMKGRK